MYALLTLSTLSVGFYLVLLVVLHRDARRRNPRRDLVERVEISDPVEFDRTRPLPASSSAAPGSPATGDVLWVSVTKYHWMPKPLRSDRDEEKVVHLARAISSRT